jgi:hypothetical protein
MEIVWREVAILSLERARTYIAEDNPAAAERVYERILRSVRNLVDMPVKSLPTATPISLPITTPVRGLDLAYPCSA